MTYWKSPQFKALQRDWYKRLEGDGFHDAEQLVNDKLVLKRPADYPYKSTTASHPLNHERDKVRREVKEHYYYTLSEKVHEAEFASDVDWFILTLYASGEKIKVICEELEKRGCHRCRETVRFTVRRYEMAWGMREYTPEQLNRKVRRPTP